MSGTMSGSRGAALIAFAASAALLLSACVASPTESVTPTSPAVSTATPSPQFTTPDPSDTPSASAIGTPSRGAVDYGDFPPKNLDELKDLTATGLPARVLTFELTKSSEDFLLVLATYVDKDVSASTLVSFFLHDTKEYSVRVGDMVNAAYVGRAVCGNPSASPAQIVCVMAGQQQTLEVGTASEKLTVADLAAFTEALYDAL